MAELTSLNDAIAGRLPFGVLPGARGTDLVLEALHPGATLELAQKATGWDLRVADDLRTTDPLTADELAALRELNA